jgi:hypothetical protein
MKIKLLLLFGIAFPVLLFSQNKTGIGNVSDNSGVLIPNAIVHISPVSNPNDVYEYVCDKNGNYTFELSSSEDVFVLNIFPSQQTLQFTHQEESISLSDGDNGILYHTVELTGNSGINFTVTDIAGNPVSNAEVLLYDTERKWRIDSVRIAKPFYTDINGNIEINSLLPVEYWFNIRKGYMTNKFTVKNISVDTTVTTDIEVVIRDLTQNEFFMCGLCDNKTWITDSIVIFGISQPYDADSKLLSDGTWFDSNGNHGYWWFSPDETTMTYNYDSTSTNGGGSTVEAELVELTDSSFVGNISFFGLPATYYMSVIYNTISLSLSVQDTTIYLNSNDSVYITPDDLFISSDYCFNCDVTLSQTGFDFNDIGDNIVYVTLEDRCGNMAVDTVVVTIELLQTAINEVAMADLVIYPNPANEFIAIECKDDRIQRVELYDIYGKIEKKLMPDRTQCKINISDLSKGSYFIRIYTTKDVVSKKIIVE